MRGSSKGFKIKEAEEERREAAKGTVGGNSASTRQEFVEWRAEEIKKKYTPEEILAMQPGSEKKVDEPETAIKIARETLLGRAKEQKKKSEIKSRSVSVSSESSDESSEGIIIDVMPGTGSVKPPVVDSDSDEVIIVTRKRASSESSTSSTSSFTEETSTSETSTSDTSSD
jgi:hypothetical protein